MRSFIVCLLFSSTASFFLFRENLNAQWSVYADHEIMVYLGEDRTVRINEIPQLLLATEVGYPGQLTRYRPGYYLSWILESYLWGDSPFIWQVARIFMCSVYLGSVLWLFYQSFHIIAATALTLLLTVTTGFSAVWVGIGPGEQYISFFGSIFLLLLYFEKINLTENHYVSHLVRWILIGISGLFLIGSKENMVIMILPVLYLYFLMLKQNRGVLLFPSLISLSLIAYSIFITWAVSKGVAAAQTDFYGTTISPTERLKNVFSAFFHRPLITTTILFSFSIFTVLIRPFFNRGKALRSFKLCGMIFTLLLIHVFFYNGWVSDSRYSFPGELLVLLFVVYFIRDLPSLFNRTINWRHIGPSAIIASIAFVLVYEQGYQSLNVAKQTIVERSTEYTTTLQAIEKAAKQDVSLSIIIESKNPYDFEPIFSVNRFLKSYGVQNSLFLDYAPKDLTLISSGFSSRLSGVLETLSQTGEEPALGAAGTLPSAYGAQFTPIRNLDTSKGCISIWFQEIGSERNCRLSYRIRY